MPVPSVLAERGEEEDGADSVKRTVSEGTENHEHELV